MSDKIYTKKEMIIYFYILLVMFVLCSLTAFGYLYYSVFDKGNVVIKHLETTNCTVDFQDISITADMTFFWIDTHSKRFDCFDDSVGMRMKLYGALKAAIKKCESEDIEFGPENHLYFYTRLVGYFYETKGPFNEGLDWITLEVKSITYPTKEKQHITLGSKFGSGIIINPYYKDNYYFKQRFFSVEERKKKIREDARQTLKRIEEMRQENKKRRKTYPIIGNHGKIETITY